MERWGWARLLTLYGFTTVFALISLVFGLWFGTQLLATQREGITSIAHIQELQRVQAQQLQEVNDRLERLERLLLTQGGPGGGD